LTTYSAGTQSANQGGLAFELWTDITDYFSKRLK